MVRGRLHRGVSTTGRARTLVCLLAAGLLIAALFVATPVAAPPPIPMRTEGHAFAASGRPFPQGTPIRTFVDGVDYSDAPQVLDGTGSYVVLTEGNSKTGLNASDTPGLLEGPNLGDVVIYTAGDFTTSTGVFVETSSWSPNRTIMIDLYLGSLVSTPEPLKIQGLVPQPARGGVQFVFLCNPTPTAVGLVDYYLERDAPGTYHGGRIDLTGSIPANGIVRVNLTSDSWLAPAGDALKLVYRNPGGANAPATGADFAVDRLEFNAAQNGTLNWEPGNTILGDAPAPGPGQILQRDPPCADTNRPGDFSLAREPGLPATIPPPSVSITSPTTGQAVQGGTTVSLAWTLSDDVFASKYLHVWVNVSYDNATVRLVSDGLGITVATWTTPDAALSDVRLRVEVQDPFGAQGMATQTFGVTRQSPLALVIAILIALVLLAFIIFGFLRARKKEAGPPPAPPPPSTLTTQPATPPTALAAGAGEGVPAEARKVCPRCHTSVRAEDVTCFFCGYKFPEDTRPPP
jgi:hypothetical protein